MQHTLFSVKSDNGRKRDRDGNLGEYSGSLHTPVHHEKNGEKNKKALQ